jgi:integrase/recombinase XerD
MTLAAIDEQLIRSFLGKNVLRGNRRPAAKLPRKNVRSSLRHFLAMLRAQGHVPFVPVEPTGPIDSLVAEYDCYLRDVVGLAPSTRLYRASYARRFLGAIFGTAPIRWECLQPKRIYWFVADCAQGGHEAGERAATMVRSFLRWLQIQGHCSPDLVLAIPHFCPLQRASLPRVMTDHQLRSFLSFFDRSTPTGRRDYAMALCQTDLGLRVGEVVALTLDDLDWRSGTIRIAAGKTETGRVLPLTGSIGRAIVDYLRHGRPATTCRRLFVRHTVPPGTPVTRYLITHVFRRAFATVKGCEDWKGTHVLRHTAATRMYREGATLKEIADILGHHCLNTTAVYTKVDQIRLAAVALPWPEEVQP